MALVLTAQQLASIRRAAEEGFPREVCGVLCGVVEGERRVVREVVACENVHVNARTRYAIAAEELISIQRGRREKGLQIVGFYHSHPAHGATWSETDLAEAEWPECSYVITGVENGRAAETRSYVLKAGPKRFEEEDVVQGLM